ncbi:MarR family winged helix-turn-helix transcriptional regulator [Nocardioides acrostichi]|uniref:MarR family transcriptional regulator n=1 Tax=Nocardioides acrostichi TaxID=2784339 RepID=A0A930UWT3_9ACTN|nr:MarR family transcriptional regulator [Nocardioides acrostichi]MBF4161591.1 MarR family transcriptional regulator [Nocardioides acrostichi]
MHTIADELLESLETFMGRVFAQAQAESVDALLDKELSITHVRALFVLAQRETAVPISDVARTLGISPATAGRAVDHLVRHGMVERNESAEDRRVKHIRLSALGWQITDEHKEGKRRVLAAIVRRIPDPQAQALIDALRPILAGDVLHLPPKETHG